MEPELKTVGDSRLTVVLCTYNGAKYIREQMISILTQDRAPDVLLVADDASTDATLRLVEETFTEFAESLRCELQVLASPSTLGIRRNMERAILDVATEFLAFADQDDIWLPGRLSSALELLSGKTVLVGSDAWLANELAVSSGRTVFEELPLSRLERHRLRRGRYVDVLLRGNVTPGMTMTGRTDFAQKLMPIPEGWVHDYWLALAAALTDQLALVTEPLVLYRQHGGNQVGVPRSRRLESGMRAAVSLVGGRPAVAGQVQDWSALYRILRLAEYDASLNAPRIAEKVHFEEGRSLGSSRPRVIKDLLRGRYGRNRRTPLLHAANDLRPPDNKRP